VLGRYLSNSTCYITNAFYFSGANYGNSNAKNRSKIRILIDLTKLNSGDLLTQESKTHLIILPKTKHDPQKFPELFRLTVDIRIVFLFKLTSL
jgi:hypothetical protein